MHISHANTRIYVAETIRIQPGLKRCSTLIITTRQRYPHLYLSERVRTLARFKTLSRKKRNGVQIYYTIEATMFAF